jgi:hypothetical protein
MAQDVTGRVLVLLKGGDLSGEVEKAKRMTPGLKVVDMPLVFSGSEEIGLEEKRLVVVTW